MSMMSAAKAKCSCSLPRRHQLHGTKRFASVRARAAVTSINAADDVIADEKQYVLQTYARPDVVFTSGEGSVLTDSEGKTYLDFAAGIAVNALGHSNPQWLQAIVQQAGKLAHTSNLFHTVPQVELAKRLCTSSFADKCFFCNSGTEANEAAIKFARKWAKLQAGLDPQSTSVDTPTEIVSFTNSFHGRTMGALAITAKTQYQNPFLPMMPGARQASFLDLDSCRQLIQAGRTAAVFVEPVQGEGGVNPSTADFLRQLRALCDEAGALLVFDEVQCGLGRSGRLWAHEHFDVQPDIMTLAKPLAGGLPIGAVLMRQHVADAMKPGDHGSTFAGNPLVCAAAVATFDVISDQAFLADVDRKGQYLRTALRTRLEGCNAVKDVRGLGLLVGIELDRPAADIVARARDKGVLIITAGAGNVIRMVPPLTCLDEEIDKVVQVVSSCIMESA